MPARRPVVLVVDDNMGVRVSLSLLLRHAGYHVFTAATGTAAIEATSGIATDLAIVDVVLPDLNGLQTAVEICKRLPNCKILLISGNPETGELLQAAERDGLHFEVLAKPMQPAELLAKAASLLAG